MTALARCQALMTKPSRETGLTPADAVVKYWVEKKGVMYVVLISIG
ncbi:Unknown protein sequence [Pseudomonas amygdali pv. morsprunorum]|nr:Unknown protein sequence [Pseudomonas amygdali pv. morsprunorum]